ncbi:hypothetical protein [Okeania sp. SIO2B3]|uniref:hypothetical protein n=1 Tax=Okeania sp. SIO2B3 TaxID=2607784 RepID=UPI0013C1B42F|nr:hypothetical protein [Okeania sp. SIO2B3]NET45968.1 hypothetical protein [Okeania sp. SIO2B3]
MTTTLIYKEQRKLNSERFNNCNDFEKEALRLKGYHNTGKYFVERSAKLLDEFLGKVSTLPQPEAAIAKPKPEQDVSRHTETPKSRKDYPSSEQFYKKANFLDVTNEICLNNWESHKDLVGDNEGIQKYTKLTPVQLILTSWLRCLNSGVNDLQYMVNSAKFLNVSRKTREEGLEILLNNLRNDIENFKTHPPRTKKDVISLDDYLIFQDSIKRIDAKFQSIVKEYDEYSLTTKEVTKEAFEDYKTKKILTETIFTYLFEKGFLHENFRTDIAYELYDILMLWEKSTLKGYFPRKEAAKTNSDSELWLTLWTMMVNMRNDDYKNPRIKELPVLILDETVVGRSVVTLSHLFETVAFHKLSIEVY